MGNADKIGNEAEKLVGQGKEALGEATNDEQLEAEGKGDQAEAGLKKAAEKVKDTVNEVKDAATKVFKD